MHAAGERSFCAYIRNVWVLMGSDSSENYRRKGKYHAVVSHFCHHQHCHYYHHGQGLGIWVCSVILLDILWITPKYVLDIQGGSNMTGTDLCVNKPHSVPVIFEPPCIKYLCCKSTLCLTLWSFNMQTYLFR